MSDIPAPLPPTTPLDPFLPPEDVKPSVTPKRPAKPIDTARRAVLEEYFSEKPNPGLGERSALSVELSVPKTSIDSWFSRRRKKAAAPDLTLTPKKRKAAPKAEKEEPETPSKKPPPRVGIVGPSTSTHAYTSPPNDPSIGSPPTLRPQALSYSLPLFQLVHPIATASMPQLVPATLFDSGYSALELKAFFLALAEQDRLQVLPSISSWPEPLPKRPSTAQIASQPPRQHQFYTLPVASSSNAQIEPPSSLLHSIAFFHPSSALPSSTSSTDPLLPQVPDWSLSYSHIQSPSWK